MKPTVYIETTIPSFYWETRTDSESVAMKDWTREWWDGPRMLCDCWTSVAVMEELESGEHPEKEQKLELHTSCQCSQKTASAKDQWQTAVGYSRNHHTT